MVVELAEKVHWVGVVDWDVRHFHGEELSTHRGTTYNAYLIRDRKTVLVDTVWQPFADEFVRRLGELVNPGEIDIIVANHAETDHSGALPRMMELCPKAQLVVSKRGAESIPGHYHADWHMRAVGTGDRISIGKRELVFFEAPMCHWPDTMFTYLSPDGILMPNDAFGQHYATEFRFNDQVSAEELRREALKYYANILTPFSRQVAAKIDQLLALKLPVNVIAPSHGVIWRNDPMQIVTQYQRWAAQKPDRSAVVMYDTMWQATRRMAEAIGDGLLDKHCPHKLVHLAVTDRNDTIADVFEAKALVIGSPTHNNRLLAGVAPILEDLRGLKMQNKIGAAFGSYGWSGESVKIIEEALGACKIPLVAPGVSAKWQPTPEDLQRCRELGRAVGTAVMQDAQSA
jgi:flavorubredoxin